MMKEGLLRTIPSSILSKPPGESYAEELSSDLVERFALTFDALLHFDKLWDSLFESDKHKQELLTLAETLRHSIRLEILQAVSDEGKSFSQLVKEFNKKGEDNKDSNLVAYHLAKLMKAGMIQKREDDKQFKYYLSNRSSRILNGVALALIPRSLRITIWHVIFTNLLSFTSDYVSDPLYMENPHISEPLIELDYDS